MFILEDFQTESRSNWINSRTYVFIFCNKKRDCIKDYKDQQRNYRTPRDLNLLDHTIMKRGKVSNVVQFIALCFFPSNCFYFVLVDSMLEKMAFIVNGQLLFLYELEAPIYNFIVAYNFSIIFLWSVIRKSKRAEV